MSITPSALGCNSGNFDGSITSLSCDGTGEIARLTCRNTGEVPSQQYEFPYDPPRIVRLFGKIGAGLSGSFGGTSVALADSGSGNGGGGGGGNTHGGTVKTGIGSFVTVAIA